MTPDGYSNETTNHVNIHHDESLQPLFRFATQAAIAYCEKLHIDTSRFDFFIIKTWLNIKKNAATPRHAHGDSHISFTYYANMPENCSLPIRFYDRDHRNEPYPGAIWHNNTSGVWDELNSNNWMFKPEEGSLFVFPSSLQHDTLGEPFNQLEAGVTPETINDHRVCLAGDILMVYKQQTPSHLGIQPVSNWRNFNDI
jgi:hypothetical protein